MCPKLCRVSSSCHGTSPSLKPCDFQSKSKDQKHQLLSGKRNLHVWFGGDLICVVNHCAVLQHLSALRHVPLWAQRSTSEVNVAKRHSLELSMRLADRKGPRVTNLNIAADICRPLETMDIPRGWFQNNLRFSIITTLGGLVVCRRHGQSKILACRFKGVPLADATNIHQQFPSWWCQKESSTNYLHDVVAL